ncbi:hypothetical protein [Hymenobacter rigui]|uniref:Uncharacterized protein n=1 Tax=Hymenobacter rigui TaxID=334424 RepID=A0A3R9MJQ2_9BACT|nr:hypothetical protein [Hymenobacter rigui]RSK47468.1 hypothetical protein EI291_14500 [Hymenobacter rigui]
MSNLRWSPYLLLSGDKATHTLSLHFGGTEHRKLLLILGKGFDVRMNYVLNKIKELPADINLDCLLICFNDGSDLEDSKHKQYVDSNIEELRRLVPESNIREKNINIWKEEGNRRRRVGDRDAAYLIKDFHELAGYTDIIIDISALPRSIYFSLIGKVLSIIDNRPVESNAPNLIVCVAENPSIDSNINDEGLDKDVSFLMGFMGGIKPSPAERTEPLIWLPLLGEGKKSHMQIASEGLVPDEICPIFPYPSKVSHRPDKLLIDYNKLLFDELRIEPQNIMYAPERNPFEVYKILVNTIKNYSKSLKELNGCRVAISAFSSKLLSIGTLLAAYQINNVEGDVRVGLTTVDSQGYSLEKGFNFEQTSLSSELFVIWLTGEPYEEDEQTIGKH